MWIVAGIVAGALLGLESGSSIVVWAVLGGFAGYLLQRRGGRGDATVEARLRRLEQELPRLQSELAQLRREVGGAAPSAPAAAPPPIEDAVAAPSPQPSPQPSPAPLPAAAAPRPATAERPSSTLDEAFQRLRGWLLGGNTVMRVGLLVLFFGFAFLARYAVEHSLLPLELRLAGIALGGAALLGTGWRLRRRRPAYAMSMQGGGIAVLYLTVFASMRLYALLPAGLAFALLLAIVALAALLAILQDAQALAVIGSAGGFLAPILASSGQGDHIALFTYYMLLNLGVLAIGWKRAWRGLNLTGFLFTFSIALAWGARDYRPELFASTEPFLIGFFLIYVAAAVLYAWRQAPRLAHYVDGGIVFGTPVVGFGLQAALVHGMEYALAWSALALGAFYLLLARWLLGRRRDGLRLLVESFLALGVAFLTLAIPLALDGRWSAAAWAMEGAALMWVGSRQRRKLAIATGLLLQLGAGLLFGADAQLHQFGRGLPVLNAWYVGTLLIALGGLFAGLQAARRPDVWPRLLRPAEIGLLAWAVLWWLGGGLDELGAWLTHRQMPAALLALFLASAVLASVAARRLAWPLLGWAALLTLPGMLLSLAGSLEIDRSPAYGWGLAAWLAAVPAHGWCLRRLEDGAVGRLQKSLPAAHIAGLWLATLAAAWMLTAAADHRLGGSSWPAAAFALAPVLALVAVLVGERKGLWPVARWPWAYLRIGGGGLAAASLAWAFVLNLLSDGSAFPLPYLPLMNPLELMLCASVLISLRWWQLAAAAPADRAAGALRYFPAVLAGLTFLLANGALLRALHQYGGVAWTPRALFASDTVQMALSLFWAILGLALAFVASRQARRSLWMVGAALLGVVVAKLFLIDMASTGTMARIVSFLGAGLLLLVVGYFSPLPPARSER